MSLAASCHNATGLIEYLCDRNLAKEILRLELSTVAMQLQEFQHLFGSFRPIRHDPVTNVLGDNAFKSFADSLQTGLQCTIAERDQRLAWSMGPVKVLTYVSLHAEFDTEERVGVALGGVVRADMRRLEDLRASYEGNGMDVMSVASAIVSLVKCLVP